MLKEAWNKVNLAPQINYVSFMCEKTIELARNEVRNMTMNKAVMKYLVAMKVAMILQGVAVNAC